jgi:hypothetical protein
MADYAVGSNPPYALPPGWFTARAADVVQLKQDVARPIAEAGNKGIVLPFVRK